MIFFALTVFGLGAALVIWMGTLFVDSNPLALLVTAIIGAGYVAGAVELLRFHRRTARLAAALGTVSDVPDNPDDWLSTLPADMRGGVENRIRGEQGGFPAPVLTPYLTGLLVMLGLLGTFVGMGATLQGAVSALEGSTELEAIRQGLTAPIEGLGMAFGTSVAGVSASAALGLVATLCRRERLQALAQLDGLVKRSFFRFSPQGYQQRILEAIQQQGEMLPQLINNVSEHSSALTAFVDKLDTRLAESQQQFLARIADIHRQLATSVDQSLKTSLGDSGRLAGESLRPVLAETLQGLTASATATQQVLQDNGREQLRVITDIVETSTAALQRDWQQVSSRQRDEHRELLDRIGASVADLSDTHQAGISQLLDGFQSLQAASETLTDSERQLQGERRKTVTALNDLAVTMSSSGDSQRRDFQAQSSALVDKITQLSEVLSASATEQASTLHSEQQALNHQLAVNYQALCQRISDSLDAAASRQGEQTLKVLEPLVKETMATLTDEAGSTRDTLLESSARQSHALTTELRTLSQSLTDRWQQALDLQQESSEAFVARTFDAIDTQRQRFDANADKLMATVASLQQQVSDTLARDNDVHRQQLTLTADFATLVTTIGDSVEAQRTVVETLTGKADTLFTQLADKLARDVEIETGKIADAADHFTVSASELASLGEALADVVRGFAGANDQLAGAADKLETAVSQSAQRSDEQLAYYVAQAREVIDHSVLSQQELIEQMRQLSRTA